MERSPGATDDVVTSITVWHAHNGRVHVSRVQLHAIGDGDFRGFSEKDTTEEFKRKFEIGFFEVQTVLMSGSAFERLEPGIRVSNSRKNEFSLPLDMGVTPALAVKFGRKIIRATNEFHHLVSPAPTMVSAESDCSLMNPSRGFEWLK